MISETLQLDRRVVLSPASTAALKSAAPWIADTVDDDRWQSVSVLLAGSKRATPDGEDSFLGFTVAKEFSQWYGFYRQTSGASKEGGDDKVWAQLRVVIGLGKGLNSHVDVLHGGVTAVILDEVLSYIAFLHYTDGKPSFTASLKVDYKAPVPTGTHVLATAELLSSSFGRKAWTRGTIEDGRGRVYATGEALMIEARGSRL